LGELRLNSELGKGKRLDVGAQGQGGVSWVHQPAGSDARAEGAAQRCDAIRQARMRRCVQLDFDWGELAGIIHDEIHLLAIGGAPEVELRLLAPVNIGFNTSMITAVSKIGPPMRPAEACSGLDSPTSAHNVPVSVK
jgi:hypothetical protein